MQKERPQGPGATYWVYRDICNMQTNYLHRRKPPVRLQRTVASPEVVEDVERTSREVLDLVWSLPHSSHRSL